MKSFFWQRVLCKWCTDLSNSAEKLANFCQQIWQNAVDEIEWQIFLQTLFAAIFSPGEKKVGEIDPMERKDRGKEGEREGKKGEWGKGEASQLGKFCLKCAARLRYIGTSKNIGKNLQRKGLHKRNLSFFL